MNVQGWRRLATTIQIFRGGVTQSYTIDPIDLEASLMRDAGLTVEPLARSSKRQGQLPLCRRVVAVRRQNVPAE